MDLAGAEKRQHAHLAATELRDLCGGHSVALLSEKPSKELTFLGSGFCISYREDTYLVTASHVAKEANGVLYLGKSGFRQFRGAGHMTEREGDDHYDIAAMPIDSALLSQVGAAPVDIDKNRGAVDFPNGFHVAIGYPISKNKIGKAIRIGDQRINAQCYTVLTYQAKIDYETYGRNPTDHIALKYDDAIDKNHNPTNAISLRGFSGAPLWATRDKYSTSQPLLVGLLTHYIPNTRVAFCTRIGCIRDFIDANYA